MKPRTEKSPTWWKSDEPHIGIHSTLARLDSSLKTRNTRWQRYLSILLNRDVDGLAPGSVSERDIAKRLLRKQGIVEKQLAVNPSDIDIQTLASSIISQRPRATFLASTKGPEGYSRRKQAERLEKAVAGEWYRGRFYQKSVRNFLHAGAVGLGAMHIYPGSDRPVFDPVPPWEFIVDEQAAINGETAVLFREKWTALERALARFAGSDLPSKLRQANEKAIVKAARAGTDTKITANGRYKVITELVRLVEAWHLPSGYGADDGRHVVTVAGATLTPIDQQLWELERFPFAWIRWSEALLGWFPQGLVEKGEPLSGQVNKLLARIQEAVHISATMRTYYQEGSIEKRHLRNIPGDLVPFKGNAPPRQETPPSMPSDVYRFVFDLINLFHEHTGVSKLTSAGTKPPGIEAARALAELKDSQTGRHALLNNMVDDYHCEAAELTVIACKQIGGKSPYVGKRRELEIIDWSEIDLDRDAYEIQIFPTSQLPHEPAGRRQEVESLMRAGFLTKAQALMLLRMPDTEQFLSLETATQDDIEMQIEAILDRGEPQKLHKLQDYDLAGALATSALLRAHEQGAPKDRLAMLMAYIEQADQYTADAQAAEAAEAAEAVQAQEPQQTPGPQEAPIQEAPPNMPPPFPGPAGLA